MSMRSVRAHGDVYRYRHFGLIRRPQQAVRRELGLREFFQRAAQRFAHAELVAVPTGDRDIHLAPGLFRRAKPAVREHRFHVFTGLAGDGDFEIVDGRRAVHREGGGKAAAHQVGQQGGEAALDDVPAHPPDDGLPGRARPDQSFDGEAEQDRLARRKRHWIGNVEFQG